MRRINEPPTAVVFALIVFAGTITSAHGTNLVVNPGFEAGDFTGWTTASAASGSFFGVDAFAHSGNFAAFLAAEGLDHDEFFQLVPTQAGLQYQLNFWVFNSELNGGGGDSLQVLWEGNEVLSQSPVTIQGGWFQLISMMVTATASGSELRFRGYDDAPNFLQIDDVSLEHISVAQAPEPGGLTLALAAAPGLGIVRRARRVGAACIPATSIPDLNAADR